MPGTVINSAGSAELKDSRLFRQACYVDAQWIQSASGATLDVDNPATGEIIGTVPALSGADTRRAIEAAKAAFPSWSAKLAKERAAILRRWFELLLENQEDLARLMTLEQGKPLAESRGEVAYAAAFLEWFAEESKRVYGDVIPQSQHGKRLVVIKQPVGVVACITPWNFPLAMITRKAGPAIGCGCTVVVKPAEQTPFSALALAELAERAGIPRGVMNVVTGDPAEIGAELTSNPVVRKLSFTGSTEIGRLLMAQCAGTVKKISLELGGNAPFIVFDDADLDAAVEGAIASKYRNTGQTCVCANRFLIYDAVYDSFAQKLASAVATLKPASGFEPDATQGPLIDDAALEKVESHIRDAQAKGAKILAGGRRHALGGRFFEPTILSGVTPQMAVAREETFGPVAPLFRFKNEAEAIALANDTEFGLAAYFYGRDISRIWRVAEALEYGIVGINTGIISTEVAPFGGVKQSGLGREGSKYGMDEYLEIKYLCFGGISS
ncbi:MAG TPA: NADP-dependent succinate-semialdehyde dehydrogenase [Candidatus Acidoferrum sp.]|nr:NADP-dependent succinate-semialdehyde dehydrogenase [Candidatus Acidoferrum sp.]